MTDEQMLKAMKTMIDPLREDIAGLKADVSGLKQGQARLEKDVSGLKQGQARLEKDVSGLKQGQARLEQDVSGLKATAASMDQRIRDTNVLIETDVHSQIRLLAEQHGDIIKKLEPVAGMGEVKSDIQDLKRTVTLHTSQIQELQKARA